SPGTAPGPARAPRAGRPPGPIGANRPGTPHDRRYRTGSARRPSSRHLPHPDSRRAHPVGWRRISHGNAPNGMSVSSVASDASYRATVNALEALPRVGRVCRRHTEGAAMPRLYGPGHFTEDPYSQVVSPHGIPVDLLVAVLQKEIRRSRVDNAVL